MCIKLKFELVSNCLHTLDMQTHDLLCPDVTDMEDSCSEPKECHQIAFAGGICPTCTAEKRPEYSPTYTVRGLAEFLYSQLVEIFLVTHISTVTRPKGTSLMSREGP